jgi:transcription elongation factor GreA
MKIAKLDELISNARVIDQNLLNSNKVSILSKIRLKNHNNNMEITYTLVSEEEANLKENKISVKSPIGQGLLGKSVGDVAEIKAPAGVIKLEVLEISF